MRHFISLATALLLGGCTLVQVPVVGKMSDGTPMNGQATAGFGAGQFWVATAGGLRCGGTYDSFDTSPSLIIPITCSDGRKGEVISTRHKGGQSGVATARLTDGATGEFVFGEFAYEVGKDGTKITQATPQPPATVVNVPVIIPRR